ncbi:MAG: hypothetical protein IJ906_04050 [Oscillospiraceae bacterium]|nr:hypothetical protein [Oscillospiraceae bacterium]
MRITVNENERGFLYKNGIFQKMLQPGTYHVFGQTTVHKTTLDKPLPRTSTRRRWLCSARTPASCRRSQRQIFPTVPLAST